MGLVWVGRAVSVVVGCLLVCAGVSFCSLESGWVVAVSFQDFDVGGEETYALKKHRYVAAIVMYTISHDTVQYVLSS